MAVSRNAPCPCGSGKKYKKCCFKKDLVEEKLAETVRDASEVLGEDPTIYAIWSEWRKAREVGDFNFLYDLLDESGPLFEQFPDRAAFVAQCSDGTAVIPSGVATFKHLRITVESKSAQLLQTIGEDDPQLSTVVHETIDFTRTDKGWRMAGFGQEEIDKKDLESPTE